MKWVIDVILAFSLGYLFAFVKYKKKELDFFMKGKKDPNKDDGDENTDQ